MPSTLRVLPGIVRLYDGVGYTGEVFTVTRLGLVSLVNLFDARARSVEMPDGWSMRLFKDSVVGPHACFQGRDSDLADDTYSDGSAVAGTASFAETFVSDDCPPVRDRLTFAPIILRPGCRNIVVNGEFEAEDGWILLNGAAFTSEIVHSGTRAMRIAPSEPTYYASASQVITIPVGFEAMLSYWVNPTCVDCDTADRQYVWIRDAAGAPHFLVNYTRDNDQMWIRREHDVSAFAGQSVRLFFSVYGDGSGETNVVYLDDVRIDACPR